MPLAPTLDALAPVFVGGLMVASFADFLGGPGFGTPTNMPWGISNFGISRHPVQLYELLVGLLALLVWWLLRQRRAYAGQLFLASNGRLRLWPSIRRCLPRRCLGLRRRLAYHANHLPRHHPGGAGLADAPQSGRGNGSFLTIHLRP